MRKSYHRHKPDTQTKKYRTNDQITAPQVRVIDDAGNHIGLLSLEDALAKAREFEFDLVEIEPTAKPPVCKIIDSGKFQYEQEKQKRKAKAKQKQTETKGVRLSLRIGTHDIEVRMQQAKRFLEGGNEVKVEMVLRGRERGHIDMAKDIIKSFIAGMGKDHGIELTWDEKIQIQGGRLHAIIGLKKP
ncbi:MAG: translation initiation factor IF-3 [bacterium]|nr:translation initiation factor IF-3 [bacterium]